MAAGALPERAFSSPQFRLFVRDWLHDGGQQVCHYAKGAQAVSQKGQVDCFCNFGLPRLGIVPGFCIWDSFASRSAGLRLPWVLDSPSDWCPPLPWQLPTTPFCDEGGDLPLPPIVPRPFHALSTVSQDRVPNNYIGGSGVVTCLGGLEGCSEYRATPWPAQVFGLRIAEFLRSGLHGVVLHFRLLLVLVLLRACVRSALRYLRGPFRGRACPLPCLTISLLLAFAGFSPTGGRPIVRTPYSSKRHPRPKLRAQACGHVSTPARLVRSLIAGQLLHICLFICGATSCPLQVWAAPAGMPHAVRELDHVLGLLPEAMGRNGEPDHRSVHRNLTALATDPGTSAVDTVPRHCVLFRAGFPAKYFLSYLDLPCTRQAFMRDVELMCRDVTSHAFIQETNPQLRGDVASFVAVPRWLSQTNQVVVVLDFFYWGGPTLAILVGNFFNRTSLAQYARKHAPEPWDVFHANQAEPLGQDGAVVASPGDVFRFRPKGDPLPSQPSFQELLVCPGQWRATPTFVPREEPSSRWYALSHHVTRTPHYAGPSRAELRELAAQAFDSEVSGLNFFFPGLNSSLQEFVFQGFSMRGVIAASPRSPSGGRLGLVTFVDPRDLGLNPFFLEHGHDCLEPAQLVAHLGCSAPPGYCIIAVGACAKDGLLQLTDEETIVLRFQPATCAPLPHTCLSAPPSEGRSLSGVGAADGQYGTVGEGEPEGPRAFRGEDPVPPDPFVHLGLEDPAALDEEPMELVIVGFQVFMPRFVPEVIEVPLRFPCEVEAALHAVDDARTSHEALHFDRLIPAVPQPDLTFGAVLAVPSWATDLACILVDTRGVNGSLFACEIRGRLNRASLFLHLGMPAHSIVDVWLHGRVLDADTWYLFFTGDLVRLLPPDTTIAVPVALEDMLRDHSAWTIPCPAFHGPHPVALLVLSDGLSKVMPIDTDTIHSSDAFKVEAARVFGYSVHKVLVRPAVPRLDNLAVLGQRCKSVVVVTEAVSQVPIPPGRLIPTQHVLLLDPRCLLQDLTWTLAPHGRADVSTLAAPFQYVAPDGLFVSVTGAPTICKRGRTVIDAATGTLLKLVHVFEAGDDASARSEEPDPSDSTASEATSTTEATCSPTDHDGEAPSRGTTRATPASAGRSRSPHRPGSTNGTWVAGLGVAYASLLSQVVPADAFESGQPRTLFSTASGPSQDPLAIFVGVGLGFLCFALGVVPKLVARGEPVACKVLREPVGRDASEQADLDALRSLSRALGGPWLPGLPFDLHHLLQTEDAEGSEVDGAEFFTPAQVSCTVLTYGYTADHFTVDLQLPATPEELLAAVQTQRQPLLRRHFPSLLPVLPQPFDGLAVFVAAPHWNPMGHGVCFDCTRIDHRFYCTFVPEYVNLEAILHCADLLPGLDLTVWVGPDLVRLEPDVDFHTFPGMLFCFAYSAEEPPVAVTLGQMLQFWSWGPPPTLPEPLFEQAYCLVHQGSSRLLLTDPLSPIRYRHDVAQATGVPISVLRLYAAHPRPTDVILNGVPCQAVVLAGNRSAQNVQSPWHIAVLDCRLLEMGWSAAYVTNGTFDARHTLDEFDRSAPLGWRTILLGDHPQQGEIPARPGQIFTLAYAPPDRTTAPATADSTDSRPVTGNAAPLAPAGSDYEQESEPANDTELNTAVAGQSADGIDITFLLVMLEYASEQVIIRVTLPIDVEAALQLVDAARDAQNRHRFPRLVPIPFQPALAFVCLLAVPSWELRATPVLFVSYVAPLRIFMMPVPSVLSVPDLFRLVFVASGEAQIYVQDTPWAVAGEGRVQLRTGDLVTAVPVGEPRIPPVPLTVMLGSPDGWRSDPVIPRPPGDGLWLLAEHASEHFTLQTPAGPTLRTAVAQHFGLDPHRVDLFPATPPIRDHARGGIPSRMVYLALPSGLLPGVPYIIDQRPVMLGLLWAYAPAGRVDVATLHARLVHHCPQTHFLRLHGGYAPPGTANHQRFVYPGQVLTCEFWLRRQGGATFGPGVPPGGDSGDSSSDGDEEDHDPGSRDPDGTLSEHPDECHSIGQDSASTRPDAGTGSSSRGPAGVHESCTLPPRHIIKWSTGIREDALPEGHQCSTPVLVSAAFCATTLLACQGLGPAIACLAEGLAAVVTVHVVGSFLLGSASAGLGQRWRAVAFCFLIFLLCRGPGVEGTPTSEAPLPSALDVEGCDGPARRPCIVGPLDSTLEAGPTRRPIPTPLRCQARVVTQPSVTGTAAFLTGLETLLEESLKQEHNRAMFLASTLVETLVEHFADVQGRRPGLGGLTPASPSRCFAPRFDDGVPACPVPPERVVLSLASTLPLTPFQHQALALGQIVPRPGLPCLPEDLVDWLDNDLRGICQDARVPLAKRQAFAQISLWHHNAAGRPPKGLIIYTDGSSQPSRPGADITAGAWAFSVWVLAETEFLLGYASDVVVDPEDHRYIGAADDTPLVCEQLAIAWGFAWAVQYGCCLSLPITFRVDCQAAELGAFGAARAPACSGAHIPTALSAFVCYLRQTACARLPVAHEHIQAHVGHVANELCDELAKRARRDSHGRSSDLLPEWPGQLFRHPLREWAWLPSTGTNDLPPLFAFEAEARRLQTTATTPEVAPSMGLQPARTQRKPVYFDLRLITVNVLTLLDPNTGSSSKAADHHTGLRVVAKREVLKKQFIDSRTLMVGLQETRLREAATLPDRQFFMFHAPADDKGHHGVALWVSKDLPYATHDDRPLKFDMRHFTVVASEPRLIVVQISAPFLHLTVVVAHSPSEPPAPSGAAHRFWQVCKEVVARRPRSSDVLLLTDANARVGEFISDSVGDHAAEAESVTGTELHSFLAEMQLCLPSTFRECHVGDSHTWCSPQGQLFRIDYIGVPLGWPLDTVRTHIWYDFEALHVRDDHWPLVMHATFSVGRAPAGSVHYARKAVRPPLQAPPAEYVQALQGFSSRPETSWHVPVDEHYAHVVKSWTRIGSQHCPSTQHRAHQSYLNDGTLALIASRKAWRLHLRACKAQADSRLAAWALAGWRAGLQPASVAMHSLGCYLFQARQVRAWMGQAAMMVFRLGKVIRYRTKADRVSYLQNLAQQVTLADLKDPRQLFQRVRRAFPQAKASRRSSFQPLPAVLDSTGQLANSTTDRLECWRSHFSRQEAGEAVAHADYAGHLRTQRLRNSPPGPVFDIRCVPSLMSVEQTVVGLPTGKAAGYDGITGELLRLHGASSARVLMPIFAKSALSLQEPVEYRGGALVPLAKRAAAALSCDKFRSILVSSLPGKVYHRQLRTLLLPALEQVRGDAQAGAVPGISTEAISMVARTFRAVMTGRRQAWAMTFFDIRAAYYRVLRQMLCHVGDSDWALQKLMHDMGVPSHAMVELMDHLTRLDTLASAGVSPHLQGIIGDLLQGTWFRMDFGTVLTVTHRGVRPGDCLADVLFAFTFSAYLAATDRALQDAGLATDMPTSHEPALWSDLSVPDTLSCGSWADDFVQLTMQACRLTLTDRVIRIVTLFVEQAESLGIQLTFAVDKTASLLACTQGQNPPVSRDEDGFYLPIRSSLSGSCHRLPVIDAYKHLGGIATVSGTPVPEIWYRHSLAMSMVRPLRTKLFAAVGIPFETRRHLLRSLAMSRYAFGSAALQVHAGIHRRLWYKNYVALWRSLWKRSKEEHYTHSYRVLGQTGAPSPPLALALSRAVLLKQVTKAGPSTLLHLLTVHWQECPKESWLGQVAGDVAHVAQYCQAARTLLDTGAPIRFLVDALQEDPIWWVQQVKKACTVFQSDLQKWLQHAVTPTSAMPAKDPDGASSPVPLDFACSWCPARFRLRKHLGAHMARTHRIYSPVRHLAHGDTCVGCLKVFHTVARHQAHLKHSDVCLRRTCRLVPWLNIDQVREGEGSATKLARRVKAGTWTAYAATLPVLQAAGPSPDSGLGEIGFAR